MVGLICFFIEEGLRFGEPLLLKIEQKCQDILVAIFKPPAFAEASAWQADQADEEAQARIGGRPKITSQKETKATKRFSLRPQIGSLFPSLPSVKVSPMHPLHAKADALSRKVIGVAIEVHRHQGPGLIESIYERCLLRELELRSIPATTKKIVRVEYKSLVFDGPLRFDLLVGNCLLLELKAVDVLHPSSKPSFLAT
jgi:GxxExxY protein